LELGFPHVHRPARDSDRLEDEHVLLALLAARDARHLAPGRFELAHGGLRRFGERAGAWYRPRFTSFPRGSMNIDLRTCGERILAAVRVRAVLSVVSAQQPAAPSEAPRAPTNLRVEYRVRPLGIDEPAPRFSFELDDPRRGATQSAYELEVGADPAALARG